MPGAGDIELGTTEHELRDQPLTRCRHLAFMETTRVDSQKSSTAAANLDHVVGAKCRGDLRIRNADISTRQKSASSRMGRGMRAADEDVRSILAVDIGTIKKKIEPDRCAIEIEMKHLRRIIAGRIGERP